MKKPDIATSHLFNILLVEPVAANCMLLQQYLQNRWQITADEAATADNALAMATANNYDLVLLDLLTPCPEIKQFALKLKAAGSHSKKPQIVALSAGKQGMPPGEVFYRVVARPDFKKQLYPLVSALIAQKKALQQRAYAQATGEDVYRADFSSIEGDIDDKAANIEFYNSLLKTLRQKQSDFFKQLDARNEDSLKEVMHSIKSPMLLTGLHQFYDQLVDLRNKAIAGHSTRSVQQARQNAMHGFSSVLQQIKERLLLLEKTDQP